MALTPEKREALKLARKRIQSRKNRFICHALRFVSIRHPHLRAACASLERYIAQQIGGERWTLETWQDANGFGDRVEEQRRQDRIAWIDWMLDEPKEA
ncbi:hypothetical protein [Burkholderia multivorans]|uniref:hypothetical protein n=1 Tax=Burkholderia TaxID=32008 RepID=UPI002019F198|nr:hypothetical protein [Burkholderia multivorans]MCO1402866.1 hypothetical protein [Burkholderia multivorans]UQO78610.1 hypothetical protein L0Z12_06130 [Burkholderia multivorans]